MKIRIHSLAPDDHEKKGCLSRFFNPKRVSHVQWTIASFIRHIDNFIVSHDKKTFITLEEVNYFGPWHSNYFINCWNSSNGKKIDSFNANCPKYDRISDIITLSNGDIAYIGHNVSGDFI